MLGAKENDHVRQPSLAQVLRVSLCIAEARIAVSLPQ